jgi:hypothetical protein
MTRARRRERDAGACDGPELEVVPRRVDVREAVREERVHDLDDARAARPGGHPVRRALHRGQRVVDRDGALALGEHDDVVLRVSDGHHVVVREPERLERRRETARLGHAGREHHHSALVEHEVEIEAELVDGAQHLRVVRLGRGDDDLPGVERHAARAQRLDERDRRWRREQALVASGPPQCPAVLGDDEVEEVGAREDALQVRADPAGGEDETSPGRAQPLYGALWGALEVLRLAGPSPVRVLPPANAR